MRRPLSLEHRPEEVPFCDRTFARESLAVAPSNGGNRKFSSESENDAHVLPARLVNRHTIVGRTVCSIQFCAAEAVQDATRCAH